MLAAKSPNAVRFDDDEIWRIQRAQAALVLHVPPGVIDDMPELDVLDVLHVNRANKEIEAWRAQRQIKRR